MTGTVTIRNPGLLSLIVDPGRRGYSDVGVPSSAALDLYACEALYALLEDPGTAVIEVLGPRFALQFTADTTCAIAGARVKAFLDDIPLRPWASFTARKGSLLRIREVTAGFRYYVGFAGGIDIPAIMGSYTTNLECGFGGFAGRPLRSGDVLSLAAPRQTDTRIFPDGLIPPMTSPYLLRVTSGPESAYFNSDSLALFWGKGRQELFTVSTNLNRTGIRLQGKPLVFTADVPKSIISEGILPGTVQIPGDGLPIIMLNERTIGGYARVAVIVRADLDTLAHLKAGDLVCFALTDLEDASARWRKKCSLMKSFPSLCR